MMGTKVTGKTFRSSIVWEIAQAMAFKSHQGFNMEIVFLIHILKIRMSRWVRCKVF